MTGVATITSKNQLTLPADLVKDLGLGAGSKVFIKRESKRLVMEIVPSLEEIRDSIVNSSNFKNISVERAIKKASLKEAKKIKNES